jgi:hypothetical protein
VQPWTKASLNALRSTRCQIQDEIDYETAVKQQYKYQEVEVRLGTWFNNANVTQAAFGYGPLYPKVKIPKTFPETWSLVLEVPLGLLMEDGPHLGLGHRLFHLLTLCVCFRPDFAHSIVVELRGYHALEYIPGDELETAMGKMNNVMNHLSGSLRTARSSTNFLEWTEDYQSVVGQDGTYFTFVRLVVWPSIVTATPQNEVSDKTHVRQRKYEP